MASEGLKSWLVYLGKVVCLSELRFSHIWNLGQKHLPPQAVAYDPGKTRVVREGVPARVGWGAGERQLRLT